MTMRIADRVTRQIKERKLHPMPHWRFALRNDAFWALTVLTTAFGGAVMSLWLLLIEQEELDVYATMFRGWREFLVLTGLPIAWMGALVVLVWLAISNARHTKRGYRWPLWQGMLSVIGVSAVLGVLLHMAGWSENFDALLRQQWGTYRHVREWRMDFWSNPQQGMLAGTVESTGAGVLFVRDFEGLLWNVDTAGAPPLPPELLWPGMPVRILGTPLPDGVFLANDVRPWRGEWLMPHRFPRGMPVR